MSEHLFIFNSKMLYFPVLLVINKKYIKDREMFCLHEKRKNSMLYVETSNDIENIVKLKTLLALYQPRILIFYKQKYNFIKAVSSIFAFYNSCIHVSWFFWDIFLITSKRGNYGFLSLEFESRWALYNFYLSKKYLKHFSWSSIVKFENFKSAKVFG